MPGKYWKPEEDEKLLDLLKLNLSVEEMAFMMGRGKDGIYKRAAHLYATGRTTIRRKKERHYTCIQCKKRPSVMRADGRTASYCKLCRAQREYEKPYEEKRKAHVKHFVKKHGRLPKETFSHEGHGHKTNYERVKCRRQMLKEQI